MAPRQYLILILTAFLLLVVFAGVEQFVRQRSAVSASLDFTKFYMSARELATGGDIYRPVSLNELAPLPAEIETGRETLHPNLNTPFAILLFWPFAHVDLPTAIRIWTALSFTFILSAAWALGGVLMATKGPSDFHRWMAAGLLALVLCVYYPSLVNAALGQFGQLLLAALASAWLAARQGHDRLAGFLFGFAFAVKPFTGLLLLIFPWLGRWRLLRWYGGTFAGLTLGGILVVGPDALGRYVDVLGAVNWHASGWNASLTAPLTVLYGGGDAPGWFHWPWLANLIWIAASAVLYATLVVAVRRIADRRRQLDLAIAGAMPLMLLMSPLGWLYYFPVIWITVTAIFSVTHSIAWRLSAVAALFLCGLPFPFVLAKDAGQSLATLLATSADTGALLVNFTIAVATACHLARSSHMRAKKSVGNCPYPPGKSPVASAGEAL